MLESSTFNFPSTRNTVCYILIKYNLCILWQNIFYDYDSHNVNFTVKNTNVISVGSKLLSVQTNQRLMVDTFVATFKIDYEILTLQRHFR